MRSRPVTRTARSRRRRVPIAAWRPRSRCWRAVAALVLAMLVLLACLISPALRVRLFPRDLAARRPWVASTAVAEPHRSGVGPSTRKDDLFFHTEPSDHPWIEIDLGAPRVIRRLQVENRLDCCMDRGLPLDFDVFDETRGSGTPSRSGGPASGEWNRTSTRCARGGCACGSRAPASFISDGSPSTNGEAAPGPATGGRR